MHPSLHADMTLYSLLAVAQRWRADSRGELTSESLFGHSGAGLRHDFPSHLDSFCRRTGGAYGAPVDLALNHTVLPYFTAFRGPDHFSDAVATMAGPSVERLKFTLGLPASRMGARFPLGYCTTCVQSDEDQVGYAYWHRVHQLPGVHVCPQHGALVQKTQMRIDGRGRTRLFLPDDDDIRADTRVLDVAPAAAELLRRLAALSQCALTEGLHERYDPSFLHECYRFGLAQQGWLTSGGSIRATSLIKAIASHFRQISHIAPFDRLISDACVEGMLCLVRKPRNSATTLAHLILIEFLFGDWNQFVSAYQWQNQLALSFDEQPVETSNHSSPVSNELESSLQSIAMAYQIGEGSLTGLCEKHGVELNTAMRWLGRLGLADIVRRPRVLTTDVRSQAEALLKEGRTQKEVCALLSLSKATVDRILNASPSLYKTWQTNRHLRQRDLEREKLERFIETRPETSLKVARTTPGSGYCWLSRHDRAWLRSKVSAATRKPIREQCRRKARINWSSRDQECLLALQAVVVNLEFNRQEIIAPPAILRRLPTLSFKPYLARLPKSKMYMAELLTMLRSQRSGE